MRSIAKQVNCVDWQSNRWFKEPGHVFAIPTISVKTASYHGSRVRVGVEPTNEEWVAAQHAATLVSNAHADRQIMIAAA